MEISITNYRNIKKLGITIEDEKINYLFGICGSGKSSILDAISKPIEAGDTTIGTKASNPTIAVNGKDPDYSGVASYSLTRQEALFREDASEEIYHVFVGDESILNALEKDFESSIENLRGIQDKLYALRGRVDDLIKLFGKPGVRGFGKASKISKAHDALKNASANLKASMTGRSLNHLEWKVKGFTVSDDFDNGVCPFCERELPGNIISTLRELRNASLKEMRPTFESSTLLTDLKIKVPDFSDDEQVETLKKELIELFNARNEIEKVINFCNVAKGSDLLHGVPRGIEIKEVAYKYVPDLRPLIEDVENRKRALTEQLGKMSAAFKRIVGSNSAELNKQLKSVGIPYEFVVRTDGMNRESHQAAYVLKHVRADENTDMREQLSYGERNLIALLLFLHNNESRVTLIDDPASSYDDFRRSQIYSCIMAQSGKTVLVVSHDQAFVRRAVNDASNEKLGKILFLENRDGICAAKAITKKSFVFLDREIKQRIKYSVSYYQKILNARLYCDIHKSDMSEEVWGYTSAILHSEGQAEVFELLNSHGTTEQEIINELKEVGIILPPMPVSVTVALDADATDFEVLILAREALRKNKATLCSEEKVDLAMLNDLVHMNDSAWYCLNPYEYAIWPSNLDKLITKYRKQSTNS